LYRCASSCKAGRRFFCLLGSLPPRRDGSSHPLDRHCTHCRHEARSRLPRLGAWAPLGRKVYPRKCKTVSAGYSLSAACLSVQYTDHRISPDAFSKTCISFKPPVDGLQAAPRALSLSLSAVPPRHHLPYRAKWNVRVRPPLHPASKSVICICKFHQGRVRSLKPCGTPF